MNHRYQPLITVIVAVFNGAKTFQQCIDSFSNQNYLNKQLIIIDGGSNDGTVELIALNKNTISYAVSENDSGIYNAWNKGLKYVKGEWILFLGADDFFLEGDVLSRLSSELVHIPSSILLAYAKVALIGFNDKHIFDVGEPWEGMKSLFLKGLCLPHQGVLHRRELFEKHGNFNESFLIAGDYELLLRELKTSSAVFIPNITITGMRQGGISSNPNNSLCALREIRRAQMLHQQPYLNIFMLTAFLRAYLRFVLIKFLPLKLSLLLLDFFRRVRGLKPYWTKV